MIISADTAKATLLIRQVAPANRQAVVDAGATWDEKRGCYTAPLNAKRKFEDLKTRLNTLAMTAETTFSPPPKPAPVAPEPDNPPAPTTMNPFATKTNGVTPLYQQYMKIKAQYPDALLFFRLGDFYEMLGDDAEKGAKALDLVLTSRPTSSKDRVPMAGFPHHALDTYLERALKAGYTVAVCEQERDATDERTIRREVKRVVTPEAQPNQPTVLTDVTGREVQPGMTLQLIPSPATMIVESIGERREDGTWTVRGNVPGHGVVTSKGVVVGYGMSTMQASPASIKIVDAPTQPASDPALVDVPATDRAPLPREFHGVLRSLTEAQQRTFRAIYNGTVEPRTPSIDTMRILLATGFVEFVDKAHTITANGYQAVEDEALYKNTRADFQIGDIVEEVSWSWDTPYKRTTKRATVHHFTPQMISVEWDDPTHRASKARQPHDLKLIERPVTAATATPADPSPLGELGKLTPAQQKAMRLLAEGSETHIVATATIMSLRKLGLIVPDANDYRLTDVGKAVIEDEQLHQQAVTDFAPGDTVEVRSWSNDYKGVAWRVNHYPTVVTEIDALHNKVVVEKTHDVVVSRYNASRLRKVAPVVPEPPAPTDKPDVIVNEAVDPPAPVTALALYVEPYKPLTAPPEPDDHLTITPTPPTFEVGEHVTVRATNNDAPANTTVYEVMSQEPYRRVAVNIVPVDRSALPIVVSAFLLDRMEPRSYWSMWSDHSDGWVVKTQRGEVVRGQIDTPLAAGELAKILNENAIRDLEHAREVGGLWHLGHVNPAGKVMDESCLEIIGDVSDRALVNRMRGLYDAPEEPVGLSFEPLILKPIFVGSYTLPSHTGVVYKQYATSVICQKCGGQYDRTSSDDVKWWDTISNRGEVCPVCWIMDGGLLRSESVWKRVSHPAPPEPPMPPFDHAANEARNRLLGDIEAAQTYVNPQPPYTVGALLWFQSAYGDGAWSAYKLVKDTGYHAHTTWIVRNAGERDWHEHRLPRRMTELLDKGEHPESGLRGVLETHDLVYHGYEGDDAPPSTEYISPYSDPRVLPPGLPLVAPLTEPDPSTPPADFADSMEAALNELDDIFSDMGDGVVSDDVAQADTEDEAVEADFTTVIDVKVKEPFGRVGVRSVKAKVYGTELALHRMADTSPTKYVVTHIPTGCAVVQKVKHLNDAAKFADAIQTLDISAWMDAGSPTDHPTFRGIFSNAKSILGIEIELLTAKKSGE